MKAKLEVVEKEESRRHFQVAKCSIKSFFFFENQNYSSFPFEFHVGVNGGDFMMFSLFFEY